LDIERGSIAKASSSLHFRTPLATMQVSAHPQSLRKRPCTMYRRHLHILRTASARIRDWLPSILQDQMRAGVQVAQAVRSFSPPTASPTAMAQSVAIVSLLPAQLMLHFPAGVPYRLPGSCPLCNRPATLSCCRRQTRNQKVKAPR
jgi:hypothetical protein